jgi:hypothetical protein
VDKIMLFTLFGKTENKLTKVIEDFDTVKKDFSKAFDLAKAQRDELLQTKKELEEANQEILEVNDILASTNKLLSEMAHAAGGLICRKDADGRYLFINEYQCQMFFEMQPSCSGLVIGRTDIELIEEFKSRTGKEHTFGDICANTDKHCKSTGKCCLYVEFGKIGDRDVVLKTIKTPITKPNGEDDGIVVFGWDVTFICNNILDVIKNGLLDNTIEKLDNNVYWIKEKHLCSLPFVG